MRTVRVLALNLLIPDGGCRNLNRFASREIFKTRVKARSLLTVPNFLTKVASNISVFTETTRLRLK